MVCGRFVCDPHRVCHGQPARDQGGPHEPNKKFALGIAVVQKYLRDTMELE